MAWAPISLAFLQYQNPSDNTPASGFVLKAYEAGTSTNAVMAVDNTGSPTFTSIALNASGYPENSGTEVIPHIDRDYKLVMYATQADADANTGALRTADNLIPVTVTNNFALSDANASSMQPVIDVLKETSGTPANGHGASISYTVETAAGSNEIGMEMGTAVEDVTPGSEDFKWLVKLMKAGAAATDVVEIGSTGIMKFLTANPQILGGDTDGVFSIRAGATNILGAGVDFYGDTHGSKAGDIELKNDNTVRFGFDLSATKWTLTGALDITGVVTVGGSILSDTDSTDSLGSTGVRWLKLWVDDIAVTAGVVAVNLDGILGATTPAAITGTALANTSQVITSSQTTGKSLEVISNSLTGGHGVYSSASNSTFNGALLTAVASHASGTGIGVNVVNAGSGDGGFFDQNGSGIGVHVDSESTSNAPIVTESVAVSTNFERHLKIGALTIWISDGTTADGALSGVAGDLCLNGGTGVGQCAYCDITGTNWTDM